MLVISHRLIDRDPGKTHDTGDDGTLTHPRQKLAAESAGNNPGDDHQKRRCQQGQATILQHPGKSRGVKALEPGLCPTCVHFALFWQKLKREDRRQEDRHQQRAQQGKDKGPRHRLKHLPFDPLQSQDRQKDQGNDSHAESDGTTDLTTRRQNRRHPFLRGERASEFQLPLVQSAQIRLGHDHRTIDENAEVNCSERKETGGNPHLPHAEGGKEHRHGDGSGNEETGAQVAQEEKEDGDDENRAGNEVVLHRLDDVIDQFGAVVDGLKNNVFGQRLAHFLQTLFQRRRHFAAVLPHEHETEAENHFPFPLRGDGAATQFVVDAHFGNITHPHRNPAIAGQDDGANLFGTGHLADAMHQQRLPGGNHLTAADIGVVCLQGITDVTEGETIFDQRLGGDNDVILPLHPSPGINLGNAGDFAQLRLHHPVMQAPEFVEAALRVVGTKDIMEDLTKTGGDRPKFGAFDPRRQGDAGESFHDQLPRIVDRHVITKGGDDLGKTELGDRTDADQGGQTGNSQLHRHGQLPFHLFRTKGRSDGVDLHLHRRGVGEGIDRQVQQRPGAGAKGDDKEEDHQQAVPQREFNQAFKHNGPLVIGAGRAETRLEDFGFQGKALRCHHLFVGVQAGFDQDRLPPARPGSDAAQLEEIGFPFNKDKGFAVDHLHGIAGDLQGLARHRSEETDLTKESALEHFFRIFHLGQHLEQTRLSIESGSNLNDFAGEALPFHAVKERLDRRAELGESNAIRRQGEFDPHAGKVDDGEEGRFRKDRLTGNDAPFRDDPGQWRTQCHGRPAPLGTGTIKSQTLPCLLQRCDRSFLFSPDLFKLLPRTDPFSEELLFPAQGGLGQIQPTLRRR